MVLTRQRRLPFSHVLPTLVEDLLDIVGRSYDGIDYVVLHDVHETMLDPGESDHPLAAVGVVAQTTSVIPIVFAALGDPVGGGLVEFPARPGGNATGLSLQQTDAAGKRLELLRDVVPSLRRLAIMANIGNPCTALDIREAEATARALGLEVATSDNPSLRGYRARASTRLKAAWKRFMFVSTRS